MSIRLLEPAQQELDEAIVWYNLQAPGLGDAFPDYWQDRLRNQ